MSTVELQLTFNSFSVTTLCVAKMTIDNIYQVVLLNVGQGTNPVWKVNLVDSFQINEVGILSLIDTETLPAPNQDLFVTYSDDDGNESSLPISFSTAELGPPVSLTVQNIPVLGESTLITTGQLCTAIDTYYVVAPFPGVYSSNLSTLVAIDSESGKISFNPEESIVDGTVVTFTFQDTSSCRQDSTVQVTLYNPKQAGDLSLVLQVQGTETVVPTSVPLYRSINTYAMKTTGDAGGVWKSNNESVATIAPETGVIQLVGVGNGQVSFTYEFASGDGYPCPYESETLGPFTVTSTSPPTPEPPPPSSLTFCQFVQSAYAWCCHLE